MQAVKTAAEPGCVLQVFVAEDTAGGTLQIIGVAEKVGLGFKGNDLNYIETNILRMNIAVGSFDSAVFVLAVAVPGLWRLLH